MATSASAYRAQLIREGRLPEAYQAFQEALEAEPHNPNLLFNAGMGAYLLHQWAEAAEYWTRVKALQLDDSSVRAQLVQVHELLDNRAARDIERAGLYALRQRLGGAPPGPALLSPRPIPSLGLAGAGPGVVLFIRSAGGALPIPGASWASADARVYPVVGIERPRQFDGEPIG